MNNFDLAIALRVYPKISKEPLGNFENKFDLFRVSFKSLLASLAPLQAKFYVILDSCDQRYATFISNLLPPQSLQIEQIDKAGNAKTFLMQLQWLQAQADADIVFVAEDDYLYQPGMFGRMVDLIKKRKDTVHFISPHNHWHYYSSSIQLKLGTRLMFENGEHWHSPVSTCLTFLTTKNVLAETSNVFSTYAKGNFDFSIFVSLVRPSVFRLPPLKLVTDRFFLKSFLKAIRHTAVQVYWGRSYVLAVPIVPVATHMQNDELGPGVDWGRLVEDLKNDLSL
jgi:hypothetical protein